MKQRTHPTKPMRRYISLCLATALTIAACGDSSTDEEETTVGDADVEDSGIPTVDVDEGATDEEETTVGDADVEDSGIPTVDVDEGATAPEWTTSPLHVRNLKNDRVPDHQEGSSDAYPCAFRSGILAVHNPPADFVGYTPAEVSDDIIEQLLEIGVTLYESADPVMDSGSLRSADILASPVYLMFPAPGRMFFPGTIPVPSIETQETYESLTTTEVKVAVVDTGGWDGMPGQTYDTNDEDFTWLDEESKRIIDTPWTYGHGAFIGDIIHQNSGIPVTHYRVRKPEDRIDGDFDEILVDEQLARVATDYDIVNLSLGTFPCYVNGEPLVPVITLASAAERLGRGTFLVAAAGNSDDDRLTMPAGLADGPETWGGDWSTAIAVDLHAGGPVVVAVGAESSGGPDFDETYTTRGDWVTTYRSGCHDARHPGGVIVYPPSPASVSADVATDETIIQLTEFVYWCGSSFAAPVVTAEIASCLHEDESEDSLELCLSDLGITS